MVSCIGYINLYNVDTHALYIHDYYCAGAVCGTGAACPSCGATGEP